MVDQNRGIPNGEMMIRDTGGWVEFWFKTGSSTFNHNQAWHAFFDGVWHDYEHDLVRGGNWQQFGAAYLPSRQNIIFRIDGSGLGWGTSDLSMFVERARVPDPPSPPYFIFVDQDTIRTAFDYAYDGGMGIDDAEIWWSDDPNNAKWLVQHTRDYFFEGLIPGVEYFFWGKVHNPMGWSGLSARSSRRTLRTPDAPTAVNFRNITQNSVHAEFGFVGYDGGTPIREWQMTYGTDPNVGQVAVSGATFDLTNLQPAQRYYFWARGRNDLGWSPWSVRSDVLLTAGAYVRVGGEYKRAIVWVKVNGVWKLTRVWTKAGGTWRGTQS